MTVPPPIRPGFTILRDGQSVPPALEGGWVAIGNFDGLHRGHRAAIGLAIERARAAGRPALVLTFEPHPAPLLHAGRADLPADAGTGKTAPLRG
jgi:riboflavin kinase / FMN adenylyltransferase